MNDLTEQSFWVQEQAPAGNYFDVLGTPNLDQRSLKTAQDYVHYVNIQGRKARIVLRTDVVIQAP
jgi:hypothetical protein